MIIICFHFKRLNYVRFTVAVLPHILLAVRSTMFVNVEKVSKCKKLHFLISRKPSLDSNTSVILSIVDHFQTNNISEMPD